MTPPAVPVGQVLRELDAERGLPASELVTLRPDASTFAADDAGTNLEVTVTAATEHGAAWAIAFGASRVEYVRASEAGGVELLAVLDHDEHALSRFEPGLVLSPAELEPGASFESTARMTVTHPVTGAAKARGTATMTVRRLDDAVVAEHGRLARTSIGFRAALGLARVANETVLWTSADVGVVMRDEARKVSVLGLPTTDTHVRWRRQEPAE